MKKRLMMGLLAGGLLVGMLPAVVSAAPPGERDGHGAQFSATVRCDIVGGGELFGSSGGLTWAGIQGQLQKLFNEVQRTQGIECVPGTKEITLTKLS